MTTTIVTVESSGFYSSYEHKVCVERLSQFLASVRAGFEERVTAIGVIRGEKIVGVFVREPDIGFSMDDGEYEIRPSYAGQEYVLYRPSDRGFWTQVAGNLGIKWAPK